MATANTTNARFYSNGQVVNCETSATFNSSRSTESVVCKDSASNPTIKVGEIEWSIVGNGFLELQGTDTSGWDILNDHKDGTMVTGSFQVTDAGGQSISGSGYFTDFTMTSEGVDNIVTFDFTFTGSGAYSVG